MLHSFVAVKLLSRLPAWAMYGQRVAPSLVTTPFLALHIHEAETESFVGQGAPNLFVISHENPNAPSNEYFTLNHPKAKVDTRTLTVMPPLPFQHPLYLFITPRIRGDFLRSETYKRLAKVEQYQLDKSSLERLLKAVKEAGPSIPGVRETSNGQEPLPEWDTWSGESPREEPGTLVLRRHVPLSFDLVPFKALSTNLDASVLEQIALYSQLYLDYTWEGCRLITEYIESMREALSRLSASGRIFRSPSLLLSRDRALDPLVHAIRPSATHLLSQPIPHDGDPRVNDEDELADDWKDEDDMPFLEMEMANVIPAVKAEKVKIIALDCDAIIDNDGALQQALVTIFPPSVHQFTAKELLDLYIEKEALLRAEGLQESAHTVIQEVARYLGATVSQSAVQDVVACFAKPTLYEDASSSISSLVEDGYVILALPGPKTCDVVSQNPGVSLAFCDVPEGKESLTWDSLLEFCKGLNHDISRNEILVVTPNLQAVAEPAALTGFPTVFIKRAGSRSAKLTIPTFSPTYTVATMDHILPILLDPSSAAPAQEPEVPENFPPLRIRGCYQVTFMLGSGSYGYIWNGTQLTTGAGVAIKVEIINPTEPSTLSYEAAIYAQLEGVRGVPRIHWSGLDQNAHVLVMDKLGPNLEKMRRFCRGVMSLKTVLMLAEQMVNHHLPGNEKAADMPVIQLTTIEEVHARGIIVRDIKPENFAMGLLEEYKCLYLLDMGLCKLYFDPTTGKHMPFREGRGGIGTPRYASHNVHFGLEPSRRDDVEAIGILLLYLLHGRLPWQGICAPDIPSKLKGIGEMKRGKPFTDLLAQSPAFFVPFFKHCRSLAFEEKPDYAYLRKLLRQAMEERRWEYDWKYDWWSPGERGTLLPDEYKFDKRFIQPVRHRQDVL